MAPPPEDIIPQIIGPFGLYHWGIVVLLFLSKFSVAFNQLGIIFLDPKISYTCPSTGNETCPCPNPVYNFKIFKSTITSKWNLICDKKSLGGKGLSQMIFQLGTLMGSMAFGMAADRFGRKLPLLVAITVQFGAGMGATYVEIYWLFSFLRFLVGCATGGTMVTTFVLIMEFVGKEYRELVAILYQVIFMLGCLLLPAFGYFLREYQKFQLAITLAALVQAPYFCFIPESPRWLIAVNQPEKAIKILTRAAKINKLPTSSVRSTVTSYQKGLNKQNVQKGRVIDLFLTPNMRKNIMAMSYNWLNVSYCFYGLSQYMGQMSGNIFVNVACSSTVTLVGSFLAIPLMNAVGRKTIMLGCNATCCICLVILAFVPQSLATVILGCIGVVISFVGFITVYLYCIEMFPTVVRNAALGYSSMLARVGSMIAPYILLTGDFARWMPPIFFALAPFLGVFATLLLPETKGCALSTTLEEGEAFGKKPSKAESSWWPFEGWLPFTNYWPFK